MGWTGRWDVGRRGLQRYVCECRAVTEATRLEGLASIV